MKSVVITILILALGLVGYLYYQSYQTKSRMGDIIQSYQEENTELDSKVDSLRVEVKSRNASVSTYKDSLEILDSLYKSEDRRIKIVRRRYEKKISRINNYTSDSIIQYLRSRYSR